jgi:hypothetical protein
MRVLFTVIILLLGALAAGFGIVRHEALLYIIGVFVFAFGCSGWAHVLEGGHPSTEESGSTRRFRRVYHWPDDDKGDK